MHARQPASAAIPKRQRTSARTDVVARRADGYTSKKKRRGCGLRAYAWNVANPQNSMALGAWFFSLGLTPGDVGTRQEES